jgi:membrane protein DedA with SNARE-associated domain
MINDLLDWLQTFTSSPWFYLVIFVIAYLDSVVPVVPSETTVILGGIAAGQGKLSILFVVGLGAVGAYLGDSTAYAIGSRSGRVVAQRFFRGENGARRLEAAAEQIRRRGGLLLITARFIPGGRTAVTFSCGLTHQPYWRWFTRWDALAATAWACYAGLLGYFFGDRFKDSHTTAFWWAFGTAIGVTVAIEGFRWLRHRGKRVGNDRSETGEPAVDLDLPALDEH